MVDISCVQKDIGYQFQDGKGTMASSMEAIVGAVWVDSAKSLDEVRRVMQHLRTL